jgi:hypothetical protein
MTDIEKSISYKFKKKFGPNIEKSISYKFRTKFGQLDQASRRECKGKEKYQAHKVWSI